MFRGREISIPLDRGYSGNNFPQEGFLTKAFNVHYDEGRLRKLPGMKKIDSTGVSGACIGLAEWEADLGSRHIISAWSGGEVYLSSPYGRNLDENTLTTYSSAPIGPVVMVEGGQESGGENRKLFVFSEEREPFYVDGTATSSSSLTLSSDWSGSDQPSAGIAHDSRIIAFGNRNNPHGFYATSTTDHTDFSSAGGGKTFQVVPGLGQEIRGAASLLTTRLYLFKYPYGIVWVDTSTIATDTFLPASVLSDRVGLGGPRGIARVGSDTWFIAANGHIHSLVAVDDAGDLRDSDITAQLNLSRFIDDHVDLKRIKYSQLIYDDFNKRLYANYTSKTGQRNNFRMIIDFKLSEPRITFDNGRGALFESSTLFREKSEKVKIYCGGGSGFVRVDGHRDRDIDGSGYTAEFRIPDTDLGFPGQKKRIVGLELLVRPTQDTSTLTVQTFVDGKRYDSHTVTMDGPVSLGDTKPFSLGPTPNYVTDLPAVRKFIRMGGIGERFSFDVTSPATQYHDFEILEAKVWVKPLTTGGFR